MSTNKYTGETMNNSSSAKLIICMGVSGCGKSTLAKYLADQYKMEFLEADDFHSQENKEHMASGKALTDAMREPWIQAICDHLKKICRDNNNCVLAYSGLRKNHRNRFRELANLTLFLHMEGSIDLITQRMNSREGHFMPSSLLSSQFDALESTDNEHDVKKIDISRSLIEIAKEADLLASKFLIPGQSNE